MPLITNTEQREREIIRRFVEKLADVWFFEPKQCWNAAVTCFIDLQQFSQTPEAAKEGLIQQLFVVTKFRRHIVDEWAHYEVNKSLMADLQLVTNKKAA